MAKRVLVVDDEPQIRAVVAHAFGIWGWTCEEAEDGIEGIEALREEPCELVVTDLIMPRAGGLDLVSEIKQSSPDTNVIAMTGRAGAAERARLRQEGVRLLAKPFTLAQLKAAAEEALAGPVEQTP